MTTVHVSEHQPCCQPAARRDVGPEALPCESAEPLSPRLLQQKEKADRIQHSPRMVAQRRSLHGSVQRIEAKEEDPVQGRWVSQCGGKEEEEAPVQGKFSEAQGVEGVPINDNEGLEAEADAMGAQAMQAKLGEGAVQGERAGAKPNATGLPDQLKSGVEDLSGLSLDNVRVHYNSSKPAQLNALAYAQGTDIHVASGQERHLPHEAWHVVQQAQGRVQPTRQLATSSVQPAQLAARVDKINEEAKTGIHPNEESAADSIKNATDKAVIAIATGPVADPKDPGWLGRFESLLKGGSGPWAATLGYAVETIATPLCEGQKYGTGTLLSQQTRGGTRPDFVLSAPLSDNGWFDITSEAGHVNNKAGNWATRKDFPTYEIVYDQISPVDLTKARSNSQGDNSKILETLGNMAKKKEGDLNKAHDHFAKYPVIDAPGTAFTIESVNARKEKTKEVLTQASADLLAGSVTKVGLYPQAARAILSWYRGNTSFMYQYGFKDVGGGGPAHGALLVNLMMDLEKPALEQNGVFIELKG